MTKTLRRRRFENKTNYQRRFSLLKSDKPRIVIRVSNAYVLIQLVVSEYAKDKVLVSASSKDLLSHGWPQEKMGSLKSIQAAYLTGLHLGKKIVKKHKHAILDSGLRRNVAGSRIYSALKGLIDSGMDIPHSKSALPSDERMKTNKNLSTLLEKIKEKI